MAWSLSNLDLARSSASVSLSGAVLLPLVINLSGTLVPASPQTWEVVMAATSARTTPTACNRRTLVIFQTPYREIERSGPASDLPVEADSTILNGGRPPVLAIISHFGPFALLPSAAPSARSD